KAEGMMMLIRSMSPDVIVVDEIGRQEDAEAIEEALHAGIIVAATAHGLNADDAARRPALRQLLTAGLFARIVTLRRIPGSASGVQADVCDAAGRLLQRLGGGPPGASSASTAAARRYAAVAIAPAGKEIPPC
ncbi:MAG: stage sporulation protein, partial [Paenibacillus sp.]|nr:stage sporulation protein [Paenibacillus sp.]